MFYKIRFGLLFNCSVERRIQVERKGGNQEENQEEAPKAAKEQNLCIETKDGGNAIKKSAT